MKNHFTKKLASAVFMAMLLVSVIPSAVLAAVDVGATAIVNPSSTTCPGVDTVKAYIKRFGTTNPVPFTIDWEVNGINQTGVVYNGSGLSAVNDSVLVTLGAYPFSGGTNNVIRVYTSRAGDVNNANDTADLAVSVQLYGTYTIGGASPDFTLFNDAVTALTTYGVCGPVTFDIRPGSDTMQAVIPEIAGADSLNTITFESETGDSSSVVLTYPSSQVFTPTNYLILLDGADYITFHQLTLERHGIDPYGHVVVYQNNATHNTISNCEVRGIVDTMTTNSNAALIYSSAGSPSNDSVNTFTNNLFKNGSLGVYMNGINTVSLEESTVVTNNVFVDQHSKAIQMSNEAAAIVTGNVISSTTNFSGYAGMYLDRCQRNQVISKNKINNVRGTGLYMVDCTGLAGIHGIVANNFISCSDSAAISMINGDNTDVIYNSLLVTGTNTGYSALFARGTGMGKTVVNNILANTGGGYSYVVSDSAVFGVVTSNYNDLYTTGTRVGNYNGTNCNTIAAWIAAAHKDSSSVKINPSYVSGTDLHATSISLDNKGTPLASVLDDIDGDVRSLTIPDIGADEYTGLSHDISVVSLLSPAEGVCGSAATPIRLIIHNVGGYAEHNFNVTSNLATSHGPSTHTFNVTDTLQPGAFDTVTVATINTVNGDTIAFTNYSSLANDDVRANDTVRTTVHIKALPAAPVASGTSICGPGPASLTAASTDTIHWYDAPSGGTLLGIGSPFTILYIPATDTFYVSAVGACESNRTAVIVTVHPLPSVNLGNDTSIVLGDSITFDAGAGFTSYSWSNGATTRTITVHTGACYTVTVSDGLGCTNSDTICLNIIQPFDVGAFAVVSPGTGDCENTSAQVTIQVKNFGTDTASEIPVTVVITGIANANFTDTVHASILPGGTADLTMGTINTLGGGAVNVHAYTSYTADQDRTNDTLNTTVTVVPVPAPPTGLGGSRCGPGPIVISAIGSDTVFWYDAPTGGNLLFIGNTYSIPFLASSTTFYAQTGNHCPSQTRRAVPAGINPLPVVNLGADTTATDSLVLDAGAGFTIYSWSPGGQTSQTITVYSPNTYSVTVQDTNGCPNSDTINVNIIVGLPSVSAVDRVSIYPNPAHGQVSLEVASAHHVDLQIRILDTDGRILKEDLVKNLNGIQRREYSLADFAKGVYFIQLISEKGSSVERLVIQ